MSMKSWSEISREERNDVINRLKELAAEARREHEEVPDEGLDMQADALTAAAKQLKQGAA